MKVPNEEMRLTQDFGTNSMAEHRMLLSKQNKVVPLGYVDKLFRTSETRITTPVISDKHKKR